MVPDILNLSETIKLCGYSNFTVTTLLTLFTVAVAVGNHNVVNKKYSVAAEETTVLYSLTPRTKFCVGDEGFCCGKLLTVTVCPSFKKTSLEGKDGIDSSSQGVTHV